MPAVPTQDEFPQRANLPGTCCSRPYGPPPISKPTLWHHLCKHSMLLPPAYFLVPLIQLFSKAAPKAPHSYINYLWFAADKSLKSRPFNTNSSITSFRSQTHQRKIQGKIHPARSHLGSISLSAWIAQSNSGIQHKMALWLTPSWDPQQNKYGLVILQCIWCEITWISCIRSNMCMSESKFTDRAVTAENHISGLCFSTTLTPHYNRDLWRAVSNRDLLGTINELPQEAVYIIWMQPL